MPKIEPELNEIFKVEEFPDDSFQCKLYKHKKDDTVFDICEYCCFEPGNPTCNNLKCKGNERKDCRYVYFKHIKNK